MLEIYIISSLLSFILMTAFIKLHDDKVLVSDLLKNLITSFIPVINLVILVLMIFSVIEKFNIMKKKIF